METSLVLLVLLRCWCVSSLPRGQSTAFSVTFSNGTLLLVGVEEAGPRDVCDHRQNKTTGFGLSLQVLSSFPVSQDPGLPRLLVCLLTGLKPPVQEVLWWVDDTPMTSSDTVVSWVWSEEGGAYTVTSVWEVSAADWRSGSTFWCGTIQEGRAFRQKVC